MAVGTGIGFNLDDLDKALKAADKSMERLLQKSGKFSEDMVRNFLEIGARGVDPFLSKLREQQTALEWLANVKLDGASKQFESLQRSAANALDSTNKLVEGFEKIARASATYNASAGLHDLKIIDDQIKAAEEAEKTKVREAEKTHAARQKEYDEMGRLLNEEDRLRNELFNAQLERIRKENEARQKAIQDARNAEIKAHEDRQREYDEMGRKLQEYDKMNASSKASGQRYAAEYEERTRYYERWINEEFLKEQEKNKRIAESKLAEERRINQQISQDRIDQLGRESQQRQKIEQMIRDTQKRNHDQRQKELEDLFREQERQAKAQAKYDSASRRERYKAYTTSYEGAIRTSDRAKTIAQEIQAVRNLEAARAKLNTTTEEGKKKINDINNRIAEHNRNIDQATGRAKNLERQHQRNANQMMTLQSLAGSVGRALAGMFGIQAIKGYVNKLIQVRGEFELQHKSLQVLIGDIDKANELWDKTVALAVKSPFRVKDLVTYTKQLAAYRVEADKLYDTNKMLADVSAGLGVDMNRLILAFGQVKAANFLRGTELRQFSEAGVNMLEELSKRYTELEGRMVSVGEVFERVSKRMVSFSDVEAVFKTITSEGGSFYRMQEKQSETLRGMVMNLKDSIDLMFNEIGESNEGLLKGAIERVRDLVDNWQQFVTILQEAGVAFVAMKIPTIAKALGSLGTSAYFASVNIKKTGLATTIFGTGIKRLVVGINSLTAALLKNPLFIGGAIAAGLLLVVHQFMRHNKEVAELNKKYDELSVRESNRLKKLEDLTEKARAYNKNIEESEEILSKSAKGTEEYANAEKKLSEARSSNQQLLDAIKKDYPQIYDSIKKNTDGTIDLNAAIEEQNRILAINIALNEQAKAGLFHDDLSTNAAEATIALNEERNALSALQASAKEAWTNIISLKEKGRIKKEDFSELEGIIKSLSDAKTLKDANAFVVRLREIMVTKKLPYEIYGGISESFEELRNSAFEGSKEWSNLQKSLDRLKNSFLSYITVAKEIDPEKWQETAGKLISSSLEPFGIVDDNLLSRVQDYIETITESGDLIWKIKPKEYTEKDLKGWQKNIWDAIKKVNDSLGDDLGQNKVVISLQDMIELDKENIFKNLSEQVSTAAKNIDDTIEAGLIPTQERFSQAQLDAAKASKPLIKSLSDLLAIVEKSSGKDNKGRDEVLEKLKNRINLVKEMNKEYEKLNKTFSKAETLAKVQKAYADTAKELGLDTSTMDFTDEGTIKSLEALLGKPEYAANKYVIELQKALDNFKVELGIEVKQEKDKDLKAQVQELFDQYDLSLELKKLNIPSDLAKSLFNVDYLDLDGLRRAVQLQGIKFIGTDMEDEYRAFLEKIDDMEDKAAKERMKTYVKYLQEGMSERVKLKIEELRKLKEIEESAEFTPEQKERIKAGVSKEAKKAQDKQEWENFKGTDMYTLMFEDLEFLGTKAIGVLQDKLESLKGSLSDLDASDVKEIIGQINKIEDVMIEENPFKYMKNLKEELKNMKSEDEYQLDLFNAQKLQEEAQQYIDTYNAVMSSLASEDEGVFEEIDAQTLATWTQMLRLAEQQGKTIDEIVKEKKDDVKASEEQAKVAAKGLNTYKRVRKTLQEQHDTWGDIGGKIDEVFDVSKELMTTLGANADGVAMSLVESGQAMGQLITSAVQFGLQMEIVGYQSNMALGVIGWILIAIQAIAKILSAIFSAKDKALQKQVEDNLATVERLQKTYDKLDESIDNAWDTTSIRQYNKDLKATTESMIAAQKAAIAAKSQDKKAKKEGTDEWKELQEMKAELDELENQLEDSLAKSFSKVTDGILDDVHDAAREFTDAWWDAFVETGDGLKGLEDNFNEMFLNLAKNQAAMQITGAFADQWKRDLEKYINADDTELTKEEARQWAEKVRKTFPQLSDALEGYLGAFRDMASEMNASGLSALQKGISGITESQAEILTAYWNSVRGYTASIDSKMDLILANMGAGTENNPMLEQLRSQTGYLMTIKDVLSGASSFEARAIWVKLAGQN